MRAVRRRWQLVAAALLSGVPVACGRVAEEPLGRAEHDAHVLHDAATIDIEGDVADATVGAEETVDAAAPPDALRDCGAEVIDSAFPAVACNNGKDDDGDGLVDWLDPECTSPFDEDESSFALGIPGDGIDECKQDCAFDGNSGSGDDGCLFPGQCRPGYANPRCTYSSEAAADPARCPKPSAHCRWYCGRLLPNGCDMSGCCDVFDAAGKVHRVRLASSCTFATLADPTRCPPCDFIPDAFRPCGRCDYCLGRWKVPSDCAAPACADGTYRCAPDAPCPFGGWCVTGRCAYPLW